ncbi:hypothetical protein CK203_112086 [Vitis vinifera]|uniref:Membrane protein PM19L n=2 Tax=Vitis vinifera TaxID=29760 RepID=A0A438CEX7_VITVI|nr:hypothetical protein CK203_112086 [Vitis vinifera]
MLLVSLPRSLIISTNIRKVTNKMVTAITSSNRWKTTLRCRKPWAVSLEQHGWFKKKGMATVGRNMAAPLLFLNLILYILVVGFGSWCLNRLINGQTNNPGFGGNGATMFFLVFAILAGVVGVASKFSGGNHIRAWRNDSLAAAGSSALVAWAITALAFGLACKEIHIGGHRGWRLRVLEALIIILTFTQLLYLMLLHAGVFSSKYGPGYRDTEYGTGAPAVDPGHKGGVAGTRV